MERGKKVRGVFGRATSRRLRVWTRIVFVRDVRESLQVLLDDDALGVQRRKEEKDRIRHERAVVHRRVVGGAQSRRESYRRRCVL